MTSRKRLKSVCHNIAHHAQSGLSYIHPHVVRACRDVGAPDMHVELLDSDPCPSQYRQIETLRLSLQALRGKFESILVAEGFALADVARVSLQFTPYPDMDDYCCTCHASLQGIGQQSFECRVGFDGRHLKMKKRS